MTTCKKCGAPIKWIKTKGGWEPCNILPIEYRKGSTPDFEERVVTEDGKVVQCTFDFLGDPDGIGYISHFRDCLFAEHFKGKRDNNVQ